MKQPRITRLLPVLVALALLSCRKEEPLPVPSDTGKVGTVAFRVYLPVNRVVEYGTKATQTSYDTKTQINFLFYNTDGTLDQVSSRYYPEPPPGGVYYLLPEEGMRYVYVVANVPYDLRETVPTITDLKNFSFQASAGGVPQNHMFGWLSPDEAGSESPVYIASDKQFDVYLKRLVAMVTVAFDRNDNVTPLDDYVTITPTRIALKNVPATMRLGENKITAAGASVATGDLVEDPSGVSLDLSSHTTSNPALFLYENRQPNGVYTDDQTMKIPAGHTAANLHTNYTCSYLEVTANYSDITPSDPKAGTITYRFFLGKNVTDNFDVERNTHYKVTLVLKGKARSEVTWRVEKTLLGVVSAQEVLLGYKSGLQTSAPIKIGDETTQTLTYSWTVSNINDGGFLNVLSTSGTTTSTTFTIPLASYSAYTPLTGRRTANFTVHVTGPNGNFDPVVVTVRQIPRVINPVAIYGQYDNTSAREIVLQVATNESFPLSFAPLVSKGSWQARVLDGAGFIRLGSQAGNTVLNGTVNGVAGSQVRFYYQPDSPTGTATDNRFGRIEVTYEDGSLEHIIYVRQGYGDVQMTNGGAWWSTFNALGNVGADAGFKQNPFTPSIQFGTFLTTLPTATGWFFKWGNNGGMHPFVPGPGNTNTANLELTLTVNGNPNTPLLVGWTNVVKNVFNWNVTTNNRGPCPSGYVVATSGQYTTLASGSMVSGYVLDEVGQEMGALAVNGSTNLFFPMGSSGYGIRNGANSGALEYAVSGTPSAWYWARGADGSTAAAHAEFTFGEATVGVLPIPNITTAGKTQDSGKFVRCVRQ
ncbi:MAG: hypothetical protein PHT64_02835 [Bacteroidales bacterium]|nr:hypothetical protein [Bacteroidales bacterium]MDD3522117.1 hypothetical protein [Bacteroidales bacterium]MDD4029973.1 hypothetical protein [Bacteroidales bacterium]MDD4434748.1 hypothetical protein [Bacteroidales bacterium]MDD5732715.1 hypothetical protein [Bacteroidales bacterium]